MFHWILTSLFVSSFAFGQIAPLQNTAALLLEQEDFFLFPEEENGILQYELAEAVDCFLLFRDGVGLKKSNGNLSTFWGTKTVNFERIEFVELDTDADQDYFSVHVWAWKLDAVAIRDSFTEDEEGRVDHASQFAMRTQIRVNSLEKAQKIQSDLLQAVELCKK